MKKLLNCKEKNQVIPRIPQPLKLTQVILIEHCGYYSFIILYVEVIQTTITYHINTLTLAVS